MHTRDEVLHDSVLRVALRTPTLPPATTTNTLVVGRSRLAIIEPATPFHEEQGVLHGVLQRLRAEGREPAVILLTHHHVDHIGAVEALRQAWSIPVRAHAETAARVPFAIDEELHDGQVLDLGDGVEIEAVFTPGHAPGHLVFRERSSGIAYAGDMVAGEGTIVIDPHDSGDMGAYLRSLSRLRGLAAARLVPSHGPVIDQPSALVDHYVRHRLAREAKVVAAIVASDGTPDAVLARAYDDTPRALWPLAARSLQAHVDKLLADGRVALRAGRWRVIDMPDEG